jgi:hypothetical protein
MIKTDEVTLRLIYLKHAYHGKTASFMVPETRVQVWLPLKLITIEDNPVPMTEIDVICKRWLAEKEELI